MEPIPTTNKEIKISAQNNMPFRYLSTIYHIDEEKVKNTHFMSKRKKKCQLSDISNIGKRFLVDQ